ncbi:LAMI_0C00100g1_1 [Lachancea mirantina]|uniref:LAMI_0C00100g1_1 n=1 Tax=Lachancea mirantina TaxID=1230905 RepID=A0A1G4IZX2_9SACH|nr:LAMI_0C00100g1_1 [Lachancea mirantina]
MCRIFLQLLKWPKTISELLQKTPKMPKQVKWTEVGPGKGYAILSPAYVACSSKDIVFTSGCVGTDPKTGELPENLESQITNALENLKNVLSASGSSMDNVLKVLLFVGDGSYSKVVNEVYQEYFPSAPARSCIVVSFPDPALKVELECIAQTL